MHIKFTDMLFTLHFINDRQFHQAISEWQLMDCLQCIKSLVYLAHPAGYFL